ncbi:36388_t:CDS:2, partial [Gigaspora margarita]
MIRKTKSNKKNTTYDYCKRTLANPNKLREHLKRKNLCKHQTINQEAIQVSNQTTKLAPEALLISPVLSNNEKNKHDQREKLVKRWKELGLGIKPFLSNNLDSCQTLFHDLEQYDKDAVRPSTKEKLNKYEKMLEPEASPEPRTQFIKKDNKSKNLINEEFNLEFREQEELGTVLKSRAIVVHHAKVLGFHSDNGNDKPGNENKKVQEVI